MIITEVSRLHEVVRFSPEEMDSVIEFVCSDEHNTPANRDVLKHLCDEDKLEFDISRDVMAYDSRHPMRRTDYVHIPMATGGVISFELDDIFRSLGRCNI